MSSSVCLQILIGFAVVPTEEIIAIKAQHRVVGDTRGRIRSRARAFKFTQPSLYECCGVVEHFLSLRLLNLHLTRVHKEVSFQLSCRSRRRRCGWVVISLYTCLWLCFVVWSCCKGKLGVSILCMNETLIPCFRVFRKSIYEF